MKNNTEVQSRVSLRIGLLERQQCPIRALRAQHRRAGIDRFGIKGVLPCARAQGQDSLLPK